MTLYLYSVRHNDDKGHVWCSPPFWAANDEQARLAVVQSLYEISLEEEFDLHGNVDSVVCLGEFDPIEMLIKGYDSENQGHIFYLSDLIQDVSEFEKE